MLMIKFLFTFLIIFQHGENLFTVSSTRLTNNDENRLTDSKDMASDADANDTTTAASIQNKFDRVKADRLAMKMLLENEMQMSTESSQMKRRKVVRKIKPPNSNKSEIMMPESSTPSLTLESKLKVISINNNVAASQSNNYEETTPYDDELHLPDMNEFTSTVKHEQPETKHIYRVPKKHTHKTVNKKSLKNLASALPQVASHEFVNMLNTSSHNILQVFTSLFDHNFWNIHSIRESVSKPCANDLEIYLNDLKRLKNWGLKVSDSSGRYSGMYFFGNDFWFGSKLFCQEVNDFNRMNKEFMHRKFIEMGFYAARIMVKFDAYSSNPKLLQLGQCLPIVCTPEDVSNILRLDPASQLFTEYDLLYPSHHRHHHLYNNHHNDSVAINGNDLKMIDVRRVPGEYDLWKDRKFYILSIVTVSIAIIIIIASWYESKLMKSGYIFETENFSKDHKKSNLGKNFELYQMNRENNNVNDAVNNNNNNNNNMADYKDTKAHKSPECLGILSKLLLCFAASSNSKTILSVDLASEDSVTCIHGLRIISLLWTVLVHTYLQMFAIGENRFGRVIAERTFFYQMVGNATYSVDTFFFISGLLVVLLYLRNAKKSAQTTPKITTIQQSMEQQQNTTKTYEINDEKLQQQQHHHPEYDEKRNDVSLLYNIWRIFLSVLYRFIRLTPVYLFVVVFNELALKWTYDRSVFAPGIMDHITCEKYWWRNISYINNWYPFSEMCMIWSWYLANDMQFYIMAIILLTISVRYFKTSLFVLISTLSLSLVASIFLSLHFNYTHKVAEPFESFDILYDKPWQRSGPYIMGMLTGYIYFKTKKQPPKVPFLLNLFLWILSLGILFAIVFGVWNGELSVIETSLYVSFGHLAWGIALIWITLSCCWGYANCINNILSYRGFFPLSRLTYCCYLIHPVIMVMTSFKMEAAVHLQHVFVVTLFFGNAVISYIFAYFMSLMFEAPVIKLLKIIFKK
uniref:Putative conserved plasma membrane protein n=1 Tax=Corethrella appendiculata TaxID=1370023 RepID=U5EF22_9DIPT